MTRTQRKKIKQTIRCKLGFHNWRYLGAYENRRVCKFCLKHQRKVQLVNDVIKWKENW